jgi:hypothetical protein
MTVVYHGVFRGSRSLLGARRKANAAMGTPYGHVVRAAALASAGRFRQAGACLAGCGTARNERNHRSETRRARKKYFAGRRLTRSGTATPTVPPFRNGDHSLLAEPPQFAGATTSMDLVPEKPGVHRPGWDAELAVTTLGPRSRAGERST